MDPTTFIFFVFVALGLFGLWARHYALVGRTVKLEAQMGRFVSDVESEKDTRRRTNATLTNRLRILEGQKPLPPYDDTET